VKPVGIEAMSAYCGLACVEVDELFAARGLDPARMRNLMMARKTVPLPCEDVVTYAVNAARPLVREVADSIELLVIGTESGIDCSKSVGTWVHGLLGLPRNCRLYEVKQACYGGLAALQGAVAQVALSRRAGARALVIGADVPWVLRGSTLEPSQGAGAVAALVGHEPKLAIAEPGAAGYCSFDVTDLRRPTPAEHILDTDLSLVSYVECLRGAYADYVRAVPDTDFRASFDQLVFHTPFPGGVKGFHRSLLRSLGPSSPGDAEADFARRVERSIRYPAQVGNIYAATTLLALLSLVDHVEAGEDERRIGVFSYGSGCSSEFCSYRLPPSAAHRRSGLAAALSARAALGVAEYDRLIDAGAAGAADHAPDLAILERVAAPSGERRPLLMLTGVHGHRREYAEVAA
jgi:polyketide biosynthesis 3-hydroxy-3-methylglutaryl-CoA synthase-like enzyme PksG